MPGFTSVATVRSVDQIVDQIREAIGDGRLADNGRLPAERELVAQFGVSRGVIREAIKILAGMGLVESRQGAGIYVRANPAPAITQALTLSFKPDPASIDQLFEIRVALETLAIRTAIRDATDEELHQLETMLPTSDDGDTVTIEQASKDDRAFHFALATVSGNPFLSTMVQAIHGVFSEAFPITEGQRNGIRVSRQAHRDIAAAVIARDADRAEQLFLEHVNGTRLMAKRRAGMEESALERTG